METLTQLVELTEKFTTLVGGTRVPGRRFDRVLINDQTRYFIEKKTQTIYGAKSSFQYNPRRLYCTLEQMDQMDWTDNLPNLGTAVEKLWKAREAGIKSGYKQRGRPRKHPVLPTQPTSIAKVPVVKAKTSASNKPSSKVGAVPTVDDKAPVQRTINTPVVTRAAMLNRDA